MSITGRENWCQLFAFYNNKWSSSLLALVDAPPPHAINYKFMWQWKFSPYSRQSFHPMRLYLPLKMSHRRFLDRYRLAFFSRLFPMLDSVPRLDRNPPSWIISLAPFLFHKRKEQNGGRQLSCSRRDCHACKSIFWTFWKSLSTWPLKVLQKACSCDYREVKQYRKWQKSAN